MFSGKALIAVITAIVIGVLGVVYIAMPKSSEDTDNAYVRADSSVVAPKVRGLVASIMVKDNQRVHRGDILLTLDPEEFDARVASAQAQVADAEAKSQAALAALQSLDAEEQLASANVRAAQSSIRSAEAQSNRAQADRRRFDALANSGVVARQSVDQYRASAISAEAEAEHSRVQWQVSRDQASVTRARRAGLEANVAQARASMASAHAGLKLAMQDQLHTVIRAPIDGVVGDRQVQQGDYVQPGSRLLSIVPLDQLYVVANFKETQTERMIAGQRVLIEIDALPGVEFKGRVESFAPGSSSQFSLLPFEPGTGNFTKIVQRVPVRIRFDAGQARLAALRPGLSSTVSVRL